jgi:activator of 2-hydroxyglutaryl-CoA dehydratase
MVSRGICASDIVKGIHLILSDRMLKMLSGMNAEYPVLLTGGMTSDVGLLSTLKEAIQGGGRRNPRPHRWNLRRILGRRHLGRVQAS